MPIRRASVNDSAALTLLSVQLGYSVTEQDVRTEVLDLIANADHEVLVAQDDAGEVIGWVHVFRARRLTSEPFAEIGGMVVDGRRRGEGFGTDLLEAAEDWARAAGCAAMRIRCNVTRIDTHAFYEGRGYEVTKSQKVFVKHLPDEVHP